MENDSDLARYNNVKEFFMRLVEEAAEPHKFDAEEMIRYYIVNLMAEYSRTDCFYPSEESSEETLVSMLNNTMNCDGTERIKRYKRLGDYTLFVSGFFHDSLSRALIDINYYVLIGQTAYSNLAVSHTGRQKKFFKNFFMELADKFKELVDILSEVSERVNVCTNEDILRIYDRWLKTGRDRDKLLLKEKGLLPIHPVGALTLN